MSTEWIVIIAAVFALGYFGYNIGYRSGKTRALRDNRNDSSQNK